ncbi:hypothetical protein SNR37_000415 [Agarivorans aestuarii]|uniref:Uncharacterized protein n=1 Tax=Agarivorans aestuarii TaxID=1563703 RepID=A0ABU7G6R7_9ALTE|nr:hypothetical protein [Agarivorans aestuarii]MEE1675093.1 hypothetical protein [Agarivorans aestuarii]
MKRCPSIVDLHFDAKSQQAIDEIKELHALTKIGRLALLIGQLLTIFGGSSLRTANPGQVQALFGAAKHSPKVATTEALAKATSSETVQIGYAITASNWEFFFESFSELEQIKREQITRIAFDQALQHVKSPKEYIFWKTIEAGCKP